MIILKRISPGEPSTTNEVGNRGRNHRIETNINIKKLGTGRSMTIEDGMAHKEGDNTTIEDGMAHKEGDKLVNTKKGVITLYPAPQVTFESPEWQPQLTRRQLNISGTTLRTRTILGLNQKKLHMEMVVRRTAGLMGSPNQQQ